MRLIEISENNENSNEALGYMNESFENWAKRSSNKRIKNRVKLINAEMQEEGISKERLIVLIDRLNFSIKLLNFRGMHKIE